MYKHDVWLLVNDLASPIDLAGTISVVSLSPAHDNEVLSSALAKVMLIAASANILLLPVVLLVSSDLRS